MTFLFTTPKEMSSNNSHSGSEIDSNDRLVLSTSSPSSTDTGTNTDTYAADQIDTSKWTIFLLHLIEK